ncbi:MAG: DUF4091 domain-containing protein [Kiritimatiellia bacterium]
MRTRTIGLSLLLLGALTTRADYDCKVSLWRGESLAVLLPDEAHEVTEGAEGIDVARGTLLPVRYLDRARGGYSLEYKTVADRAVFGSKAPGLHFATVTAAAEAKPGTYRFGQLVVTVVDRVLPSAAEWKYYLDLWQHPWAVARVNGVAPFSAEHYRAMEPLWRRLAAAGQKTLTVTLVDKPWNRQCYDAYGSMIGRRKGADGKWSFDYSVFDQYVAFGRACGLGPHISCYTMCPWEYVVDYVNAAGETVRVAAKPGTPVFDDYWHDFLIDFEAHLREKGWLKDAYIAMDERTPEDLRYIVTFVRRTAPGLKIAMAGNRAASEFDGIEIDSYSQAFRAVGGKFLGEVSNRPRDGKVVTYYVCCNPARPNTFMSSTPGEAFVCGFYPAVSGFDGFLRWAYNSWGEDPLNDMTYNRWDSGDVALVYPDGSPSWRFLELKNGIQQAEKFRLLSESGRNAETLRKLAAMFDAKALLDGTDYLALRRAVFDALNR